MTTQDAEVPADRQLPLAGEIFLDHVGHFVRDPQAAAQALARAGFAPAPLSVQVNPNPAGGPPQLTGTGNVTAMFTCGYLEVLFKTADTPLGRQLDTGLARYPGIHLAAFAVADAHPEHARLAAAGFRMQPVTAMQRPVDTGSTPGTARFTLARVEPGEMPEGRIQMLVHHTEDTVWQPRWLTHPNGALGLMGLTIAVADVDEATARFARFTGRAASRTTYGRTIRLDRGRLDLVTADAFAALVPECAVPSLPFAGLCEIKVRSLAVLEALLDRAGLTSRRTSETLIVPFPEELGLGAWRFAE
jgi:hypothetical protein